MDLCKKSIIGVMPFLAILATKLFCLLELPYLSFAVVIGVAAILSKVRCFLSELAAADEINNLLRHFIFDNVNF
ncbi:hypothetical protein [Nostoc sp. ChiQUE01b]|uniref:hypothetical protein n=1 Tax=Nostoc sp. ChiQUE01b TaxID=3075376 RepID=UPI002AD296CF|nr:hypothetical protein [Nostoc sp. ChiQUE01b]MDZ8262481.1 hypothetical protein [Nostoc sp. ChiQUE01b]